MSPNETDGKAEGNGSRWPGGIRQIDPDRMALTEFIAGHPVGTVVTKVEMAEHMGRRADSPAFVRLLNGSTRRLLLRNHHLAVDTVRGIGWRLLPAGEVARIIGGHARQSIHRRAKGAVKIIAQAVQGAELAGEEKNVLGVQLACLGAIAHCSDDKGQKRLREAVDANKNNMLPISRTLQLYMEN